MIDLSIYKAIQYVDLVPGCCYEFTNHFEDESEDEPYRRERLCTKSYLLLECSAELDYFRLQALTPEGEIQTHILLKTRLVRKLT